MKAWKVVLISAGCALISAAGVAVATQTNYLGTVFIADTTTPANQLAVNSDGSINAKLSSIPPTNLQTGSGTGNVVTGPSEIFVCTAACTVTPPVPVAGYQFCIMNDDNTTGTITLGAIGSSARYENTARTAYGTAGTGTLSSAGAAGDMICIIGRDATHYLSPTYVGTWTAS